MTSLTLLRVDACMKRHASTSRMLADRLVEKLSEKQDFSVVERDLAKGVPFIDEQWIEANFTDPEERTPAHKQALAESDILVKELRQADILVMTVPIYNFGVPAAFKAWIDQVARARETFRYTDKGPQGLLEVRACYLIVTSGGTAIGSDTDFVSRYITLLFSFLGIRDIEIIACDGLAIDRTATVKKALAQIESL